ncbi:unnamed protein product [Phytomonas sp. EM1]|nr:unnamed protein product [Phytomonas sp. EM1]|eukprot:CCW64441.1 unnamed protein product [Phytomonas sp. isolate EM1]
MFLFWVYVIWKCVGDTPTESAPKEVALYSFTYFCYCAFAGALSGIPHAFVLPMDILKCRIQVGRCRGFTDGLVSIFKTEAKGSCLQALGILYRGWLPATCGYLVQGSIKFFLYEAFKYYILSMINKRAEASAEEQYAFCVVGYSAQEALGILVASCVAEIVADLSLAPCEAIKIKVQTSGTNSTSLSEVILRMWSQGGLYTFYRGLIPLWCRQVPSTVIKFICFERIVRFLYSIFFNLNETNGKGVNNNSKSGFSHICLSLLAGALSGVICAAASHPADTILSKLYQDGLTPVIVPSREDHDKGECSTDLPSETFVEVGKCGASDAGLTRSSEITVGRQKGGVVSYQEPMNGSSKATSALNLNDAEEVKFASSTPRKGSVGNGQKGRTPLLQLIRSLTWRDIWRGLLLRVIMMAIWSSMQWAVYDSVKVLLGFPATGSS